MRTIFPRYFFQIQNSEISFELLTETYIYICIIYIYIYISLCVTSFLNHAQGAKPAPETYWGILRFLNKLIYNNNNKFYNTKLLLSFCHLSEE